MPWHLFVPGDSPVTAPEAPVPILPRVALGEDAAFKECVRRYGRLVYALARRASTDERDIDDACQDIFVSLWRSAGSYDPARGSEVTFIALVARRRLIDRGRVASSRPLPMVDPESPIMSTALEAYVDGRVAAEALAQCNEAQRRVITLAAVQGLTHDEIAKELGLPLGTVKSHYARGIERVKRALSREEKS